MYSIPLLLCWSPSIDHAVCLWTTCRRASSEFPGCYATQAVEVVRAAKQGADGAELAVDLDLLQGRVLSAWRGHNGEALALYDQLAEVRRPQQYRRPAGHDVAAETLLASVCRNLVAAPLKAVLPCCRPTPKTSGQFWPRRSS